MVKKKKKEMSYPLKKYGIGEEETGRSGQKFKMDDGQTDILSKHTNSSIDLFIDQKTNRDTDKLVYR